MISQGMYTISSSWWIELMFGVCMESALGRSMAPVLSILEVVMFPVSSAEWS